jgi:hypothetical protein
VRPSELYFFGDLIAMIPDAACLTGHGTNMTAIKVLLILRLFSSLIQYRMHEYILCFIIYRKLSLCFIIRMLCLSPLGKRFAQIIRPYSWIHYRHRIYATSLECSDITKRKYRHSFRWAASWRESFPSTDPCRRRSCS